MMFYKYKSNGCLIIVYYTLLKMLDNFNRQAYAHSNVILPASQGKGCLMLGDFNSAID